MSATLERAKLSLASVFGQDKIQKAEEYAQSEEQIRKNNEQKIIAETSEAWSNIVSKMLDCSLSVDDCICSLQKCSISDQVTKITIETAMQEKKIFPITLGRFKHWEELLKAGKYSEIDERLKTFLISDKFPLTREKVVKNIQFVNSGSVSSRWAMLNARFRNLTEATLEDLLVFGATYKRLRTDNYFKNFRFIITGTALKKGSNEKYNFYFPFINGSWELMFDTNDPYGYWHESYKFLAYPSETPLNQTQFAEIEEIE